VVHTPTAAIGLSCADKVNGFVVCDALLVLARHQVDAAVGFRLLDVVNFPCMLIEQVRTLWEEAHSVSH
jgi:hypothetical protein